MSLSAKRKARSAPPTPDSSADSLDFTHIGHAKPAARAPAPRAREKRGEPRSSRSIAPVLLIAAIAIAAALFVTQRSSTRVVTAPRPSAQPAARAHQSPPAYTPPQTHAAAAKPAVPAPASTTRVEPHAIPADFLKTLETYKNQSGGKAVALALDANGRWAYGNVSGFTAQADANQEALVECARYKAQAGIQANCRLYAAGENVVW